MIVPLEKPGTPEELVQSGVKGMKWGIRKPEETSGRKTSPTKTAPRKLNKKTKAAVADHSKKLVDKFESQDHKLTPEQKKKIAYTVAGTVIVAGLIGGAYYLNKQHATKSTNLKNLRMEAANLKRQKAFDSYVKSLSDAEGTITDLSYKRPAFEIPAGHTFLRYSSAPEKTFGNITYATASEADFNHYASYFGDPRLSVYAHQVKFASTKSLKVPKLDTVLDAVQEVTGESRENAVKIYSELSGSKWDKPEGVKLLQNLKAKGYGALVDENDAGFLSDKPLVIFDHSGMGKKITQRLTPDDMISRVESLKDFTHKK